MAADVGATVNTTTPLPLAMSPSDRAETGLYSADDTPQVFQHIGQDLEAAGEDAETLLAAFTSGQYRYASRSDEVAAANPKELYTTVERLLSGKLESDQFPDAVQILYFAGYQRLLAKHHLRFPAYNILDEYFTNVTAPWGPFVLPRPRATGRHWSLLGRQIGFPIGVPASVLTSNSRWISYFANNGFNVLTYKTVRSRSHRTNDAPNWVFVPEVSDAWAVTGEKRSITADPWDWVDPGNRNVTTANSFGVPSPGTPEWMADVENALNGIGSDQMLIVSVMGDDYEGTGKAQALIDDFVQTAAMAEKAGAEFVELNLSCPNSLDTTGGLRPLICSDPRLTQQIIEAVREKLLPGTRLIAKLSYLEEEALAELISGIASLVDGVAGINTLQCNVTRTTGAETFPGRERAGVSGVAIREYAQDFVARLVRLRVETGEFFEILGMGGVTDPESFETLFQLGASSVQTASGAFANPFLAAECIERLGDSLPLDPDLHDAELLDQIRNVIMKTAGRSPSVPKSVLASALPLRTTQSLRILHAMEVEGMLTFEGRPTTLYQAKFRE